MAWKFNLIKDMEDPTKIIFSDEWIAVLRDAYPKAEKHFLVLPRKNISSGRWNLGEESTHLNVLLSLEISLHVQDLTQVTKADDLQLLEYMDSKGREIAEEYGGGRVFRLGYHADPSMERLHLHVISDDMNSPSLKHKKHWNNFTTPMFIESSKVIEDLQRFGEVIQPSKAAIERYLQTPLKCHKCNYKPNNMAVLKKHILIHLSGYRHHSQSYF